MGRGEFGGSLLGLECVRFYGYLEGNIICFKEGKRLRVFERGCVARLAENIEIISENQLALLIIHCFVIRSTPSSYHAKFKDGIISLMR